MPPQKATWTRTCTSRISRTRPCRSAELIGQARLHRCCPRISVLRRATQATRDFCVSGRRNREAIGALRLPVTVGTRRQPLEAPQRTQDYRFRVRCKFFLYRREGRDIHDALKVPRPCWGRRIRNADRAELLVVADLTSKGADKPKNTANAMLGRCGAEMSTMPACCRWLASLNCRLEASRRRYLSRAHCRASVPSSSPKPLYWSATPTRASWMLG